MSSEKKKLRLIKDLKCHIGQANKTDKGRKKEKGQKNWLIQDMAKFLKQY